MSKSTSRTLFLLGLLIGIIGAVVFGLSLQSMPQLTTNVNNIGNIQASNPTMLTVGYVATAIGGLLMLIAWLGGLLRTAVLGRWGWFIVLLVVGLIGLATGVLFLLVML